MTLAIHRSCFCPWDSLPPSSVITVSYPSGKSFDKAVRMGCLCRCNYLLIRCLRLAHPDIIPDSSGSEPGFLQHHTIIGSAGCLLSYPGYPYPSTRIVSAVHIIKPHQQIDNRGLSAAGRSHNRHSLSRLYLQIEVLESASVPVHS